MWTRRLSELALLAAVALAAPRAHAAPPASPPGLPDDPFAAYREQFKLGMDRYKAGALAEAIGFWEPIYRELGDEKGYRLAYDLGLAYQQLGDATHAAERLQSFLKEVEARRARGDTLAPIVEKEEVDARARIDELIATKGRIHVESSSPPQSARIDANEPRLAGFVAWVTPGEHIVTFGVDTPEQETTTVRVQAGEWIRVAPASPSPPPPRAVTSSAPAPAPARTLTPPAELPTRHETRRPFPWPLVAVSGSVAVALGIVAVPLEDRAWTLHNRYQDLPLDPAKLNEFANARTWAYAAIAGAVGFGAVTAGLAAWYLLGTSERDVILTPAVAPEHGGASFAVTGRF